MARTYLGFGSSCHDSSIAVVNEAGEVVFAEGNERALKNKRAWNVVPDAIGALKEIDRYLESPQIRACLSWSNNGLKWSPVVQVLLEIQKRYVAKYASDRKRLGAEYLNRLSRLAMYKAPVSNRTMCANLEYRLWEKFRLYTLARRGYEHHLCHAATACYTSSFDDALCIVLDGMGEGRSLSVFKFSAGRIRRISNGFRVNSASLGLWYGALCWSIGFDPILGEEWKVMGLAAYGRRDEDFYNLVRPMLEVSGLCLRKSKDYLKRLTQLLKKRIPGKPALEYADYAFTGQLVFEEVVLELLNSIARRLPNDNLIFTGGCALNSACNGKILQQSSFRNMHIPMAPGDDGNAIGSALLGWLEDHPGECPPRIKTPFLGSHHAGEVLCRVEALGRQSSVVYPDEDSLTVAVAGLLAQGKIVGWFQGRAEFGPRALGNRSILASPGVLGIQERINRTVKFREDFRPFAPSILHEFGEDYFHDYQYSPFMERTLRFKPTDKVSGVCHVNNTGRVQSVVEAVNPLFYKLICEFNAITGIPLILNTSFNVMGQPIVHDVEDALGVFFSTGLDVLVIGFRVFCKL